MISRSPPRSRMDPLGIGPCNPLCAAVGVLGDRGCFPWRDPSLAEGFSQPCRGQVWGWLRFPELTLPIPGPASSLWSWVWSTRRGDERDPGSCTSPSRGRDELQPGWTRGIPRTGSSLCCRECWRLLPTRGPHTRAGQPPLPPPPPPGRQSEVLAAEWHPGTAGDSWGQGAGQAR